MSKAKGLKDTPVTCELSERTDINTTQNTVRWVQWLLVTLCLAEIRVNSRHIGHVFIGCPSLPLATPRWMPFTMLWFRTSIKYCIPHPKSYEITWQCQAIGPKFPKMSQMIRVFTTLKVGHSTAELGYASYASGPTWSRAARSALERPYAAPVWASSPGSRRKKWPWPKSSK